MTLASDIAQIDADTAILHSIIHGASGAADVTTEGGLVPTLAKMLLRVGVGSVRGSWLTATTYALNDAVTQAGAVYRCSIAHTSGTFATDLAAAKWVLATTDPNLLQIIAAGSSAARTLANRFSDWVNVKDFGATGDGATNDSAAIVSAIAALPSGGGTVFFPPGEYVTDPIVFPTTAAKPNQHAVHLLGSGSTVSILRPRQASSYSCIKGQSTTTPSLATAPNRISRLGFKPHASGSLFGIDCRNFSYGKITDVEFIDNGTGRFVAGIVLATKDDGAGAAGSFAGVTGSAHCYDNSIDGVRVNNQTWGPQTLILGVDTANVHQIKNVSVNGTMPMNGIAGDITCFSWNIRDCYFEAMAGTCIAPVDFCTIEDCWFEVCTKGIDGTGRTALDVAVRHCYFNSAPNTAVSTFQFEDSISSSSDIPLYNLPRGVGVYSNLGVSDASGAGLTFTGVTAQYSRVGGMVTCIMNFTFPVTVSGSNAAITLPFTASKSACGCTVTNFGSPIGVTVGAGGSVMNFFDPGLLTIKTNANLSGKQFFVSISYPA